VHLIYPARQGLKWVVSRYLPKLYYIALTGIATLLCWQRLDLTCSAGADIQATQERQA
jgi:hypothetical protein